MKAKPSSSQIDVIKPVVCLIGMLLPLLWFTSVGSAQTFVKSAIDPAKQSAECHVISVRQVLPPASDDDQVQGDPQKPESCKNVTKNDVAGHQAAGQLSLEKANWLQQDKSKAASVESELFQAGPVIANYGKIAAVKSDLQIPQDVVLKVRFDVARQAKPNQVNQTFESAARLINLHAAAGITPKMLEIAIVIHGSAIFDVTGTEFYGIKFDGQSQANLQAVRALHQQGVKFYVCGQSASFHRVRKRDLMPVIKVSHSAMTAHAILASQGYSLNPF